MNLSSKQKYSIIFGAVIITLIASLLFLGRDMEMTTYRWFIASSTMGFLCGLSVLKKNIAKIGGIYLLVITVISAIMIGATSSYWLHTCFGILVPPMLLFSPPLAALAGIIIGFPILNLIIYLVNMGRKKEENQNIELQN